MVEYKCKKCSRIFNRKNDYDRHITKKNPCNKITNLPIYNCETCDKKFTRKDNLTRHLKICKNTVINDIQKINNNGNYNISQMQKGDHNKMIIKNYNLFPFGKDGIDCLTTPEKIAIFSSDENPMEMIIVKLESKAFSLTCPY